MVDAVGRIVNGRRQRFDMPATGPFLGCIWGQRGGSMAAADPEEVEGNLAFGDDHGGFNNAGWPIERDDLEVFAIGTSADPATNNATMEVQIFEDLTFATLATYAVPAAPGAGPYHQCEAVTPFAVPNPSLIVPYPDALGGAFTGDFDDMVACLWIRDTHPRQVLRRNPNGPGLAYSTPYDRKRAFPLHFGIEGPTVAGDPFQLGHRDATGDVGVPIPPGVSWEIYALSWRAAVNTVGATRTVNIVDRNNGNAVLTTMTPTAAGAANDWNFYATLGTPVAIPANACIGADMAANTGTAEDVTVGIWIREA